VCPTRYRTRHFFNNFTTNEDIATKFEADYRHTIQTHTTDTHTTDTSCRHTLQTHATDTHYRHTLQTHTTDTRYRHTLQTRYRHTLQTHSTDTHCRHTLQTHSSSFLTQRTYSCSNFVAISSIGVTIINEMPGSVASGTPCITVCKTPGN